MSNRFTQHPASVNESYFQHMGSAMFFCSRFCLAALAALVHAFLPFLFEKTGSNIICELHERMVINRARQAAKVDMPLQIEKEYSITH